MEDTVINDIKVITQILLPELGERQSMSLLLFYFYGRKRTASILNISPSSVRDNVFRARSHLKSLNKIDDVERLLIRKILQNINCEQ